jgi:hypothetical protein
MGGRGKEKFVDLTASVKSISSALPEERKGRRVCSVDAGGKD